MNEVLRELVTDNEVAIIEPGDVLVIVMKSKMYPEQAAYLLKKWAEADTGVELVVVDDCLGMAVVRQTENGGSAS